MNFDNRKNLPIEHLRIGECIFTNRKMLISTVLGSCVSVTFYHYQSGSSGIFHAILPDTSFSKHDMSPCNYADAAITSILSRFRKKRINFSEIEVKMFGGANTMKDRADPLMKELLDVGLKNVNAARKVLNEYRIRTATEHILGSKGRKIIFNTSNGDVFMSFLSL